MVRGTSLGAVTGLQGDDRSVVVLPATHTPKNSGMYMVWVTVSVVAVNAHAEIGSPAKVRNPVDHTRRTTDRLCVEQGALRRRRPDVSGPGTGVRLRRPEEEIAGEHPSVRCVRYTPPSISTNSVKPAGYMPTNSLSTFLVPSLTVRLRPARPWLPWWAGGALLVPGDLLPALLALLLREQAHLATEFLLTHTLTVSPARGRPCPPSADRHRGHRPFRIA